MPRAKGDETAAADKQNDAETMSSPAIAGKKETSTSFIASPQFGRFIELLGYAAKTAKFFAPAEPGFFFADLASDRLLKNHASALQRELKKQAEEQATETTRNVLIRELASLEDLFAQRLKVTEDRLATLIQSAFAWEAAGGRVEMSKLQEEKLQRADRAYDDLLLAAQMLRSDSVHHCVIEFSSSEPLRFLKWLFFPPRTLLIGAAFDGTLRFKDILPPSSWTNDFIKVVHSLESTRTAGLSLDLVAEYIWDDQKPRPARQLSLGAGLATSRFALPKNSYHTKELEVFPQSLPARLSFGENPKTLLMPTSNTKGFALAARLLGKMDEPPLVICQLSSTEDKNHN